MHSVWLMDMAHHPPTTAVHQHLPLRPEGMCIVLEIDCNFLLTTFWQRLPVL